jgi:predicted metal-binding transcription factor (methanogenesis marker protein 9)
MLRFAEYIFGANAVGEGSKFNIKTFETYKTIRCMEVIRNYVASDCYFTGNLENCSNCMFSFNQRNKNRVIGNIQLSNDEYAKIKEKLIEDIREKLKAKKMIPTVIDIINDGKDE